MTERSTQLTFSHIVSKPVLLDFEGGNLASHAGTLLPRRVDERLGLAETEARDARTQTKARLLGVGARLPQSVRRVLAQAASAYPAGTSGRCCAPASTPPTAPTSHTAP